MSIFQRSGLDAKIQTGTYVGTGTYGSANPNTLHFAFKPKVVIITRANYIQGNLIMTNTNNSAEAMAGSTASSPIMYTISDKSISWYTTTGGSAERMIAHQYNTKDVTYNWVAIG